MPPHATTPSCCEQSALFVAGEGGYHTYRIPALAVSANGTILAFCEGRKYSRSDSGTIHLLLRRSLDGGATWGPVQVIAAEEGITCGNPCPVVDKHTGTIWLPFCKNRADGPESMIKGGKAPRTVWMTRSDDEGASWAEPWEITAAVKRPNWTWYATGPTHGIQLGRGRLLVPCDHTVGVNFRSDDPMHSHVIYSDDHGVTWRIGGIVDVGTNECAVVEAENGAVYINCRNYIPPKRRAYAWSEDGGLTFGEHRWDESLVEPICQASLVRFTCTSHHGRSRVLFCNPAAEERIRLTVRMSYDDCRTWPVARCLYDGPAAYSDLAIAPDMNILCLYERGEKQPYETLALARFNCAWLSGGKDLLS